MHRSMSILNSSGTRSMDRSVSAPQIVIARGGQMNSQSEQATQRGVPSSFCTSRGMPFVAGGAS
jgi:hypothetical protein